MYIYIFVSLVILLVFVYSFINAKKTNERNIRAGHDLVHNEINSFYQKSLKDNFKKEESLLILSKKIDYFKQCLSVLKVMLVKKEVDKTKIKKVKVLRIIILSQLMSFIHLYEEIKSDQSSQSHLDEKINSISLSEIASLDIYLNKYFNEYKVISEKKEEDIPLNNEEETLDNFMQYYKTFIMKEISQ